MNEKKKAIQIIIICLSIGFLLCFSLFFFDKISKENCEKVAKKDYFDLVKCNGVFNECTCYELIENNNSILQNEKIKFKIKKGDWYK